MARVADAGGDRVLTSWGRSRQGRGLIVVLRQGRARFEQMVMVAVEMTAEQQAEYDAWEEQQR